MSSEELERVSIRRKSVRGLFWSAAQSWGNQLVTLAVFIVLARLLSPANFGLVAMAKVFLSFVWIFLDQGLSMAIIQRRELEQSHLSTAFWANLAVGIALTGLAMLSAGLVAALFGEPELTAIVRWLSILFLLSSLNAVQQALLKRHFDYKLLAVRNLASVAVGGIVGVTMAMMGYGVWSLVGQQLANRVVQVLLLWTVSDWRPTFEFSTRHFRDLFNFGANIIGINFTEFFSRNADKFIIGQMLGPVALGYYTIAYKLLQTLTRLVTSVAGPVAFSSFSALQTEIERVRRVFYAATQLTALVTMPMFVGLAVIAPQVVVLVFGDQWEPSTPAVQILMFVGILESIYLYNANVMLSMGKPEWRLKLNVLNAIANVVGFLIAIRWGFVAVAAAYVIRAYLLSPLPLILVRKLIGIRLTTYVRNLSAPAIATAIMAIAVYQSMQYLATSVSSAQVLVLAIAIGVSAYFLSICIVSPALVKKVYSLAQGQSIRSIVDE